MQLSNVVLTSYTTLDVPVAPVQTQAYGANTVYVGVPMQAIDLGDPYWSSNGGGMTYANGAAIAGTTFSAAGILSGTPSAIAAYPRTITATNSVGPTPSAQQHTLNVVAVPPVEDTEGTGTKMSINIGISI